MFTGLQRKWLNDMAGKGYRLIRTGKLEYEFEECEPGKYVYEIEYVGDKSYAYEKDYKEFLESLGYTVFYKNINLDYSVGKVTWRPFAEKGGQISTTETTYNKELLIIEKENDGMPFELHTTFADKINYYKRLRNPWLIISALLLLLGAFLFSPLILAIGVLFLLPALRFQFSIHKCKKESEGTDRGGTVKKSVPTAIFMTLSALAIAGLLIFRVVSGDRFRFLSANTKSGTYLMYIETNSKDTTKVSYHKADGKITRTISPKKNSKEIKVTLRTESGSMSCTIKTAGGKVLYELPECRINDTLTVPNTGEKIIVYMTFDNAEGGFEFEY